MNLEIKILPGQLANARVVEAYVVFTPGRGLPRARSTHDMQRFSIDANTRERCPNAIAYASPDPDGTLLGAGMTLAFSSGVERPLPAYVLLKLDDEKFWRLTVDPITLVADGESLKAGTTKTLLKGPSDYIGEIKEALDCEKDPARCFFAELDRRTHPQLVDACNKMYPAELSDDDLVATRYVVSSLMAALMAQLQYRTAKSNGAVTRNYLHDHLVTHANYVSRLFLTLARKYFSDGKRGIDVAKFDEAFERFALGQLTFTLPSGFTTCQPSSGYFIFFAEIGFFCHKVPLHGAEWARLLNVLVRSQVLFFRSHHVDSGPPQVDIGDYGPHTFRPAQAANMAAPAFLAGLRSEFAPLLVPDLARRSSNLAQDYLSACI